jgi:hypothetical protein
VEDSRPTGARRKHLSAGGVQALRNQRQWGLEMPRMLDGQGHGEERIQDPGARPRQYGNPSRHIILQRPAESPNSRPGARKTLRRTSARHPDLPAKGRDLATRGVCSH